MLFLNNWKYDKDPGMPTKQDVARQCHWNLWKIRMQPFNELEDGVHIVLLDSWPGGGRLTWEVEARSVLAERYSSKRSAVRMIANAVDLAEREIAGHPYTIDHPASGYVLAFRFQPIRRIGQPRPKDLRLRRHGWAKVDDAATLRRWGLSRATRTRLSSIAMPARTVTRGITRRWSRS
jgi:hypothetical protein